MLEKLTDGFRVMEAELVEIDPLLVGHEVGEILEDFFRAEIAWIVENYVDGLLSNLLEIQLRPDLRLELP